ncbi:MAG: hypothetical protein M4579_002720 [Chaenotheca gracillima]|nr:MAG: hypothetical protein M4579_002720 [Chaenotheca gracillima]
MSRLSFSTLLLVVLPSVLAAPAIAPRTSVCGTAAGSPLSDFAVPVNKGFNVTKLPIASDGLVLKIVTLGRGTQNYTCASDDSSAAPVSVGAVATLYDTSDLLTKLGQDYLNILTRYAVLTGAGPATRNAVLAPPLTTTPVAGKHFFDAKGVPTFDLSCSGKGLLHGKKLADVKAPKDSATGQSGEAAVDWLELGDAGGSTGVTQVFRVQTAGGSPPKTCKDQKANIEVQYSAQYWFFGPE